MISTSDKLDEEGPEAKRLRASLPPPPPVPPSVPVSRGPPPNGAPPMACGMNYLLSQMATRGVAKLGPGGLTAMGGLGGIPLPPPPPLLPAQMAPMGTLATAVPCGSCGSGCLMPRPGPPGTLVSIAQATVTWMVVVARSY